MSLWMEGDSQNDDGDHPEQPQRGSKKHILGDGPCRRPAAADQIGNRCICLPYAVPDEQYLGDFEEDQQPVGTGQAKVKRGFVLDGDEARQRGAAADDNGEL